uniref:Methyltransferase-like protein 22 n=1 Tax=Phallusia mammillata TaxID=59560 RepID=A0A6F9DL63_9ASCI|nr:methyltransferase-like protein 22 [Phallusia mammillata]
MEETDVVLSDVHLNKIVEGDSKVKQYTRIKFFCPPIEENLVQSCTSCNTVDEDGDYVCNNQDINEYDVIGVYHNMATTLNNVGCQLWRGALLMCDFIHHNCEMFRNKNVLELGSGIGLTGIVAAQYAHQVICTDSQKTALDICQSNIEENSRFCKCTVKVTKLDWFRMTESSVSKFLQANLSNQYPVTILVCDCVYDNALTDALFRTLYFIATSMTLRNAVTIYISLEKRLNFTMQEFDVTCKEYSHFQDCLSELGKCDERFEIKQIPCSDFRQFFEYDRVVYLELWEIKYSL